MLFLGMFIAIFLLFELLAFLAWFFASIPYKVALERNHPNTTAIRACGWLGVLTMGVFWPVALIWAYSKFSLKADKIIGDKPVAKEEMP